MVGPMQFSRYVDADSFVHRLDPRAKLIAVLLYLGAVLSVGGWIDLAALAAVSLAALPATRIPLARYLRTLRPLRFLIAFVFLIPILFDFSLAGLLQGTVSAGRMALFILFTATLTFTTDTPRLVAGMDAMLRPLRRLGLTPERGTFMLSVALRFIPAILDEADAVLKAQASRGVDFRERPWREKARALATLLGPIASGAFRRASELIDAYASRGYRPGMARTHYFVLIWRRTDTWFLLGFAAAAALLMAI